MTMSVIAVTTVSVIAVTKRPVFTVKTRPVIAVTTMSVIALTMSVIALTMSVITMEMIYGLLKEALAPLCLRLAAVEAGLERLWLRLPLLVTQGGGTLPDGGGAVSGGGARRRRSKGLWLRPLHALARLSPFAIETATRRLLATAGQWPPLPPLRDLTAPPSLQDDHRSLTKCARRQLKRPHSLSLANEQASSLATNQSQASASRERQRKTGEVKRVSEIRIRKSMPKRDAELTPMGLPRPKRRCRANGGMASEEEEDADVRLVERLSALEDFLSRSGLDEL
ncbi:unnamed protein product [Merluccius merluccius]